MARTEFDNPAASFGRAIKIGGAFTAVSQAFVTVLRFASVIVLSRLLSPGDFGIVAMAAPVVALLSLFQDFGLPQATIQRPKITAAEVNFLFWANMGISVVVALFVLGLAPLAAAFYDEPRVAPLIIAMGLLLLVQGLGAQHSALLSRLMHFRVLAAMEVIGAVAGLLVSVVWAVVDPSPWAIFGGSLATVLFPTIMAWCLLGWYPSRPRRTAGARSLVNFGAGMTGFNISNFVARNADNILIGRYLGDIQLGLYDRAYKLLLMPLRQVMNPLSRVLIPALSRMSAEPERFRSAFLTVHSLTLLAVLPGVAAMIVVARELVPFLLGPEWAESAVVFTALGFAGMLQPVNNPAGWLFVSEGRSQEFMRWGIFGAVTSLIAFVAGLPYGILGVAVAYSISEYIRTPLLWLYVGRRSHVRFRDVARTAGTLLVATHMALGIAWLAQPMLPDNIIAKAILTAMITYAIVGVGALIAGDVRRIVLRTVSSVVPARYKNPHLAVG